MIVCPSHPPCPLPCLSIESEHQTLLWRVKMVYRHFQQLTEVARVLELKLTLCYRPVLHHQDWSRAQSWLCHLLEKQHHHRVLLSRYAKGCHVARMHWGEQRLSLACVGTHMELAASLVNLGKLYKLLLLEASGTESTKFYSTSHKRQHWMWNWKNSFLIEM